MFAGLIQQSINQLEETDYVTANDSLVSAPTGLPTWINVGGNTDIAARLNHEVYRSADKWSFAFRCSKNVYRRGGSIDFV